MQPPFLDSAVREKFEQHPDKLRKRLLNLRQMVFDVHAATPSCGELVETLKWGQPAYATERPKSGSPLRIDASGPEGKDTSLYFICTTTLVDDMRKHYEGELNFVGNREIHIPADEDLPEEALKHCMAMAMTYKLKKKA